MVAPVLNHLSLGLGVSGNMMHDVYVVGALMRIFGALMSLTMLVNLRYFLVNRTEVFNLITYLYTSPILNNYTNLTY